MNEVKIASCPRPFEEQCDGGKALRFIPDKYRDMPGVMAGSRWRRFLIHLSIVSAAMFLGVMSWLIAKPMATRLHETVPGQRITVTATPQIDISLDSDSSVTVTNTEPPRIEVLRGNAYFDVKDTGAEKLQVKVGTAYVRGMNNRFSVSKRSNGGSVAVAAGQVEIQVETGKFLVGSRERADFSDKTVTAQRVIAEADIAPWKSVR
ncbi:MAG TPA: FecR domain-containing protein [Nitrosospira sp.]|nr:FecR domain-containing protein [Nitrosospira sp.]